MTWDCYMLETVEARSSYIGFHLKDHTDICPTTTRPHRLEMSVPYGTDLHEVVVDSDGYFVWAGNRVACQCGLLFKRETSSLWGSSSTHKFRNPKTGDEAAQPHTIAGYGAMWFCPWIIERGDYEKVIQGKSAFMSSRYARDWWGKRDPICVMLPGGSHWVVDAPTSDGGGHSGWTITGEAPFITASPSIVVPQYHGWLQNGVLSDDLDGNRQYPPRIPS